MSNVIGKIKSEHGEVILTKDGKWKCDNKDIEGILNARYSPKHSTGVGALLPFGTYELSEAAKLLKGRVIYTEQPKPLPEGAVS